MPLYTIVRPMPGVTAQELSAAAVRAIICSYEYPRMRWVRSYWNHAKDELLCVYEAENSQQLREHAERARIPCTEIVEVEEVAPDQFVTNEPQAQEDRTPAGAR